MGTISRIKCDVCKADVDVDSDKPHFKLDPDRKRPNGLHICPGPPIEKTPTQQCEANLEEFLRTNVIVVDEEEKLRDGSGRTQRFKISKGPHNAHFLNFQSDENAEGFKAYWLPWFESEATTITLGDEANFFFTSELTNCRFCVLDADLKRPTVAHVAGNLVSSSQRDLAERGVNFDAPEPVNRLARRLSISQGSDRRPFKQPPQPKIHEYRGQKRGDESSAFVYGLRDVSGNWSFRAQIVKGNMGDTGAIKRTLASELEILNYCYRI